jgi:hypothetical protein
MVWSRLVHPLVSAHLHRKQYSLCTRHNVFFFVQKYCQSVDLGGMGGKQGTDRTHIE